MANQLQLRDLYGLEDRTDIKKTPRVFKENNYFQEKGITLKSGIIRISDKKEDFEDHITCENVDWRHKNTLFEKTSQYYGKCVIIYMDSNPIGSMKIKEEDTFLCWQNCSDENGLPLLYKGGLYSLTRGITQELNKFYSRHKEPFPIKEIDYLELMPRRFIEDNSPYYNKSSNPDLENLIRWTEEKIKGYDTYKSVNF